MSKRGIDYERLGMMPAPYRVMQHLFDDPETARPCRQAPLRVALQTRQR